MKFLKIVQTTKTQTVIPVEDDAQVGEVPNDIIELFTKEALDEAKKGAPSGSRILSVDFESVEVIEV